MNIRKDYAGIQRDVTWDDINYTPLANRGFIHALGKTISGDTDYILQGCVFSKIAATSGTVTAGYVYDSTSGEVVQVDAQTVSETLGTNLWTLVKTTTYDSAGNNLYRDGALKDNYQQERMVLTNVASIGSGFDVENVGGIDVWQTIDNADITVITSNVTLNSSFTKLRLNICGNKLSIDGQLLLVTDGSFVSGPGIQISFPDSYFSVDVADTTNNVTYDSTCVTEGVGSAPEIARLEYHKSASSATKITIFKDGNFIASQIYRIPINSTIKIL